MVKKIVFLLCIQCTCLCIIHLPVPVFAQNAPCNLQPPEEVDEESLADARTKVSEVFGERLARQRTPSERTELTDQLLNSAKQTPSGSAEQFAVLEAAWDQSLSIADVKRAQQVADLLEQEFPSLQDSVRGTTVTCLLQTRLSSQARAEVLKMGLAVTRQSLRQLNFEKSDEMTALLRKYAERVRDREVVDECDVLQQHSIQVREAHTEYLNAERLLQQDPNNADASEVVGLFRCLMMQEWEDGLLILARASTPRTRDIASAEVKNAESITLANMWWEVADDLAPIYRQAAVSRSAYFYQLALPDLTGLDRLLAEQRIGKVGGGNAPETSSPADVELVPGVWKTVLAPDDPAKLIHWKELPRQGDSVVITSTSNSQSYGAIKVDARDIVISVEISMRRGEKSYIELRNGNKKGLSVTIAFDGRMSFGYYEGKGWKHLSDATWRASGHDHRITVAVVEDRLTAWVNGRIAGNLPKVPVIQSGDVRVGTVNGGVAELKHVRLLQPTRSQILRWRFDSEP